MKKYLLISILLLCMLTACNRTLRRDQNTSQSTPSAIQETTPVESMPAVVVEATETQVISTDIPAIPPTNTLVPTVGVSQSETITNQLDALLGQFNSELQIVDTIPETP
jgi:hypothetical protein